MKTSKVSPQLKTDTIRHLQQYISEKIKERGFEDETLQERLLLFSEEVGEVIKACRKTGIGYIKSSEQSQDIGAELADVLNLLFAVADVLSIDLEQAFLEKENKIDRRVYHRKKSVMVAHKMSLFAEPFGRIKSGRKAIEVRLYDKKRQKVSIGDSIVFERLPDRNENVTVEVVGLSRFNSFRDLFAAFDKSRFGHLENFTIEDQIKGMREVYSEKRERELGVLGIHIRLVD